MVQINFVLYALVDPIKGADFGSTVIQRVTHTSIHKSSVLECIEHRNRKINVKAR